MVDMNPPGRVLALDKMVWDQDGWPGIGAPSDYPEEYPVA